MKRKDKLMEPILWAVSGPIIAMPGYTDMVIPDNIRTKIQTGRLLMAASNQEKSSEAETMWYISTATLSAPPDHNWYKIYMWLFNQVMDNVPDDLKFEGELDDMHKQDLSRLQRWLYKKSMTALKLKLKQQEKEESERINPPLTDFFKEGKNGEE